MDTTVEVEREPHTSLISGLVLVASRTCLTHLYALIESLDEDTPTSAHEYVAEKLEHAMSVGLENCSVTRGNFLAYYSRNSGHLDGAEDAWKALSRHFSA